MVFSPIPFQPDTLPPIREPPAAEQPESTENVPTASVTSTISEFFKRMIFPPLNVSWITVSEIFYSNVPQVSFHPKRLAHLHHSVCQCPIFYLSDNIGIYAWICWFLQHTFYFFLSLPSYLKIKASSFYPCENWKAHCICLLIVELTKSFHVFFLEENHYIHAHKQSFCFTSQICFKNLTSRK